jgi:carboxylesterase type B
VVLCSYFTVIKTKSGAIRGIIQSSSLYGKKVQKFLNIPYAEAPVGQLRFEKPQAKKPWNGNNSVYVGDSNLQGVPKK